MPTSDEDIKELKAMVAVAKRKSINIGICFGGTPDETVVKLHPTRSAAALARDAKADGETVKTACGTLTVKARDAQFTCAGPAPLGIDRKLKAYFKGIGLPLKFELIDGAAESTV